MIFIITLPARTPCRRQSQSGQRATTDVFSPTLKHTPTAAQVKVKEENQDEDDEDEDEELQPEDKKLKMEEDANTPMKDITPK